MSSCVSEEEAANLATYSLQLQQVEAALTSDPSNEELRKLKSDLEEIITLTKELIETTTNTISSSHSNNGGGASLKRRPPQHSSSSSHHSTHESTNSHSNSLYGDEEDDGGELILSKYAKSKQHSKIVNLSASSLYEAADTELTLEDHSDHFGDLEQVKWEVGMQCYAPWSKDGKLNSAIIKEVSHDGLTCTVSFEGYGIVEKCTVSKIKHAKQVSDFIKQKCKRNVIEMQREKKKKKSLARMQKLKELDETKEVEKKTWKNFVSKNSNKKGINKHSIFRSSDENKFGPGNSYNAGGDCPLSKGMSSRF